MNNVHRSVASRAVEAAAMGTLLMLASLCVLALCLVLAGCGQRGPLRLPAPPASATSATAPASSPTATP
jgi:predicted small lipoprotein YifL